MGLGAAGWSRRWRNWVLQGGRSEAQCYGDGVLQHHPGVVWGNRGGGGGGGGERLWRQGDVLRVQLQAAPGLALAPSSCQAHTCLTRWAPPRKWPCPHLSAVISVLSTVFTDAVLSPPRLTGPVRTGLVEPSTPHLPSPSPALGGGQGPVEVADQELPQGSLAPPHQPLETPSLSPRARPTQISHRVLSQRTLLCCRSVGMALWAFWAVLALLFCHPGPGD